MIMNYYYPIIIPLLAIINPLLSHHLSLTILSTTQMLNGAGIFNYIKPQKWPSSVGKYSSTMEHVGKLLGGF